MTAFIVLALPVICLGAAVVIGKRAFKKTGCARTAFRKHFISVMLAALLCVAFTAFVSAAGNDAAAADTSSAAQSVSDAAALYQAVGNAAGMGFIASALAIGLSAVGAGIALAAGAPAAIGAVSEDPKAFGKAMIFVVLGEAVALYGLVVAMLIIFIKIPNLSMTL